MNDGYRGEADLHHQQPFVEQQPVRKLSQDIMLREELDARFWNGAVL